MSELFDAVDGLVASRSALPPAQERKRLRVAHGLTLDEVAAALKVRRATVSGWESVKKPVEPRGPEREAYARLLRRLADLYPAPEETAVPVPVPSASDSVEALAVPADQTPEAAAMPAPVNTQPPASAPAPAAVPASASRPERTTRPSSASRRPGV
jgi:transcriptional regulator with XRE-family HTH domain